MVIAENHEVKETTKVDEYLSGTTLKFAYPDKCNTKNPNSWNVWMKRLKRYLRVTNLSKRSESDKMDILLYIMGEDSEDILLQFENKP